MASSNLEFPSFDPSFTMDQCIKSSRQKTIKNSSDSSCDTRTKKCRTGGSNLLQLPPLTPPSMFSSLSHYQCLPRHYHYHYHHYHHHHHHYRNRSHLRLLIFALLFSSLNILAIFADHKTTTMTKPKFRNEDNLRLENDDNSDGHQLELIFSVTENVPVGSFIGIIKSPNESVQIEPPFLIVPIPGGDIMQMNPSSLPVMTLTNKDNQQQSSTTAGSVDTDLNIDQSTGEIRTAVELDRERRIYYSFIAISLTGVNVHVRINIEDVNDNAPQFPTKEIELEFPENSKPRDVKRTLPPAIDLDRAIFGTQIYRIVSGNVANAFRLISHREKDDILYLDLQVNGILDRETIANYNLVIEALDGGQPPLKDQLLVKITILDHNDCEPVFSQSHYYGSVLENVTLGTSLLKVTATDSDEGDNGRVIYMLHSKLSHSNSIGSSSSYFAINRHTGWIYVTKPLDYESQDVHELIVIARDQGVQPLETSAFVSIRVTDVNDNQPTVNILFLTANSKPEIREDAQIGDLVARVSVSDADVHATSLSSSFLKKSSKRYSPYNGLSVSLFGASDGEFGLRTADQIVYLIVVTGNLDRERRSKYQLTVMVSEKGHPPQNTSTTFDLEITDINDNAPYFDQPIYHTAVPETIDVGSSVFQMSASDNDSDSILTYAFLVPLTNNVPTTIDDDENIYFSAFNRNNHTHQMTTKTRWFSIDRHSGLITTRSVIDCETDPEPKVTVIVCDSLPATMFDHLQPKLFNQTINNQIGFTATTTLIISISDINDNEPIFEQSFYNVSTREDTPVGQCLLKLSANDADCGVNAMINYSLELSSPMMLIGQRMPRSLFQLQEDGTLNNNHQQQHEQLQLYDHFHLNPQTGQLCLQKQLDYEMVSVYDLPVLATDRGGLSTTAMIKIHVIDTNDNSPIFYPREYKVSVGENVPIIGKQTHPLVIVAATDQDSPRSPYGQIEYEIKTGNEKNYFDIDHRTGEIFLLKPLSAVPGSLSHTQYKLTVMARDGGGLESKEPALILISVIPTTSDSSRTLATPVFLQRQFNFQVIENVAQGAIVGTVRAKIESLTDDDIDDDYSQQEPISYAIYSGDPDGYFTIDPRHGTISVKSSSIDREKHSYLLVNVQAYIGRYSGSYRYAHTQVNITILDENDNVPMFPSPTLKISVPENIAVDNGTVFVAYAIDYDADQFGRVRYSLYPATSHDSDDRDRFPFVIEDQTGHVRLRRSLDYETRNEYQIRIVAIDGGQLSSEILVHIFVQDVNDNAPIFIGTAQSIDIDQDGHQRQSLPLYKIQVPENVAVNSHIYPIKATDADTGNNARLTYSLTPLHRIPGMDKSSIPVDIFPNNGVLYVHDTLDRENLDHYELLIFVTDHGLPTTLNATAVVHLTVQDINDNRPYWKQSKYIFDIAEDAPMDTLLGQVSAFDVDLDGNSTLVYNIVDTSLFRINPSTGQIYLSMNLDREIKDNYEFFVEVHDQGVPQSLYSEEKATIIVNILDINDNRPVFDEDDESNRLTVPIGTSRKSTIATFRAFDPDAGDNGTVYYGLTEESDLFTVDRITGTLVTKVDIKETLKRSTHKISLIATDGQGKRSNAKVIDIEIVDKRSLNIDLDYVEQYNFNVKSQDLVYGYRLGSIDIPIKIVLQHQCNNRFFTNFHYQIKNNLPFFVENDDTNERKLYILTFGQLDSKISEFNLLFCIDWSQCLVSILEINEIKSHHHQMIQCDYYSKIIIQIEKNEDRCLPLPIENRDLFEVKIPYSSNQSPKNNDLLYLNQSNCSSTNADMIQYELSSPMMNDDTLNRMFAVESNKILQLQRPHDKTLINQYLHEDFVLSLVAKKQNVIIQSVPIRIKIISSDTQIGNIAFMNEKFMELEEDCCYVGSPIIQARINISHDDFKVKYFLASYGERNLVTSDEQFNINPDNGLLTLKREFDFERKHEHRINITAVVYDSKFPIINISNIVKIRILNTNDEPPMFVRRSYEKEIPENAPVGQLIVQLEAKDSDQELIQSNITYMLPQSYRYANYFDLNYRNGELKLAKTLDRETIEHFYVPVYAFDDDFKHHTSTLVNVKVLDINDNFPYFVQSNLELKIPESVTPGITIYTLVAIDPDLSVNQINSSRSGLQYRISLGNTGNKFVLHEQRGELSVNAPLDREMQSIYHLIVEVSDSVHYSTCNVTIELLDINDNAPMFDKSDYYAILNEGSFGWLTVVTVRAIDSDGDKLLYRIETDSNNNLTRYLSMNSETGEIMLHSSLLIPLFDQLKTNVFTFEVGVIEAGKISYQSYVSKAKVHLTLISNANTYNVQDTFKLAKYPYVIIVDESRHSLHVNQKIGFIELSSHQNYLNPKQEKNSNNPFTYRILNGGESYRSFKDYFTIQQQTGAIIIKRPLNYNYYEAIIEVTQHNFHPKQSTMTTSTLLQIFIGGIDDRKFVQSIKLDSLEVVENQSIGSQIVNLGSFIHRSSSYLSYNYMIFYSDIDRSSFEIRDGHLKLKKSLDYESQPNQIQIIVFAYRPSDSNLHEHSYLYNLTLHVTNVDDNSPQFTQKHYIATIREGEQTGTFVAQVNAIDIDDESLIFNKTFSDRRYSYYIVDGNNDNAFSIDNYGGVRTNIVLDREIHDRYQLKIIATEMKPDLFGDFLADEASYQHLTQCILEVIIIDQNDNVPVFPPYKEVSVSEDADVGSMIATWTANDVDIHPMLSYMKLKTNNDINDDGDCFDIGLYTGKIYLKCPLKPLLGSSLVRKVKILLQASDQIHTVETELTINIKRNYSKIAPVFRDGGNFYQKLNLDDEYSLLMYEINVELFRIPMIEDPILKRKIIFSLNPEAGADGFYIDQSRGIVYNNRTIRSRNSSNRFVMLTIFARYQDSEVQTQGLLIFNFDHSTSSTNNNLGPNYYLYSSTKKDSSSVGSNPNSYNLEIESSQIGVVLLSLPKRSYANYIIVGGNTNKNFIILRGKELVLVSRPLTDQYLLKIKPNDSKQPNSTIIFIHIKVRASTMKDSTMFASPFKSQIFELEINENEKIGTEIQNLKSEMPRTTTTENGDSFHFRIFSGNELNSFRVDPRTGILIVDQKLDYETNPTYRLGVVAESYRSGATYFTIININLINANEYCPQFPSNHFKALIEENVSVGSKVIPIKATDPDQDQLNYTVIKLNEWNDNPFRYDAESGYLITDGKLDYESKTSSIYKFIARAVDISGSNLYGNSIDIQCNSVETIIEVQIGSIDEHSPQFVNDSYDFKLTTTITRSRVKIGQVLAIDSDSGPDGVVIYSIKNISPQTLSELVHINSSSGVISISVFSSNLPKQFSMIVSASSGRMNSLNSLTLVNVRIILLSDDNNEIDLAEVINNIDQGLSVESAPREAPLPGWIIFLIVLLLLITFVLMVSVIVIRMHQQQQEQQHFLSGHLRTLTGNHNVGSLFRKIGPFVETRHNDPNISPAYSVAHYGTTAVPPAPPCYNDVTITTTTSNVCAAQPEGHSASSGRGSAEDDADLDDVDEEIRMINESSNYYTEDPSEEVTTIAEYLARLGVTNHYEEEPENTSSVAVDEEDESMDVLSQISKIGPPRYGTMKKLRLRGPSVISGSNSTTITNTTAPGNRGQPEPIKHQQQPTVHNEEELSGSYNWDYLQHWGPKYQPLSSVFAEIARLKSVDGLMETNGTNMDNNNDNNVNNQSTVTRAPDIIENMSQKSASSSTTSSTRIRLARQQQQSGTLSNMMYMPQHHNHNSYVSVNYRQQVNNNYNSGEYGTVLTNNNNHNNNNKNRNKNLNVHQPSSSSSSSSSSSVSIYHPNQTKFC